MPLDERAGAAYSRHPAHRFFLGAGKTTLLNHLLRQPALAGTVVLMNEFGAVPIDHLLVETISDDIVLLDPAASAAPSAVICRGR